VLLVSFVTSVATGIVTATLVNQAPSPITQTISRVIEKATPSSNGGGEKEQSVIVVTEEDLIVNIVEDVSSAVVSVIATKDIPVIEQYFINPFEEDEFFREFFGPGFVPEFSIPQYRQKGTEKQQVSSGTGFFVSKDGFLLTNKHVVSDTKAEYSVIMNDGRQLPAEVLARDAIQDIAVLQVDGGDFNFIPLGDSKKAKVGQTVIAIGNALGEFQNTVSTGIISGLDRSIVATDGRGLTEYLQRIIQTDAAINPGNSGGPMLNLKGRVIGINTAMAQGAENVGFALPINLAKRDIEDIREFGEIRYAFLGVRYLIVTPNVKEEKGLSVDYGALLVKGSGGENAVMDNSPAVRADLREGDIILEFNGTKISQKITLAELINNSRVGQVVTLRVLRGEETLDIQVTLDEIPKTL